MLIGSIAQAHYIWIERDADGAAHGYYGEWDNDLIEKAGGNLDKIAEPKAFMANPAQSLAITRQADHLAIAASGLGDVRMTDVLVNEARKTRTTYYAKGGRRDLKPVLDLEFVPSAVDSNELTLMWHGAPLQKAEVTVYGPPKWKRDLTTDDQGHIALKTPWAGRYIVEAIHLDEKTDPAAEQGRQVATLSFVVKKGIKWDAK